VINKYITEKNIFIEKITMGLPTNSYKALLATGCRTFGCALSSHRVSLAEAGWLGDDGKTGVAAEGLC
jgi:hypothetical protein